MLLSWIGLRLGQTVGLDSPFARAFAYREPMPVPGKRNWAMACMAGSVTGLAVMGFDKAFQPFMPAMTLPAMAPVELWKRILACFYGGISEELICRLFFMTLLIWILRKFSRRSQFAPAAWMIWTGILGATFLFGVGHLPTAAAVWPLTPVVIARTVLLNAVAGIPFGFLYWRKGLEHAMVAHFCGDIVLHVLGGS
jgi:membrane protease YdiL (CAAX protease family)